MKRLLLAAVSVIFSVALIVPAMAQNASLRQNGRYHTYAGTNANSGALALFSPTSWLDIGTYNYGWTMMTPWRIEFHPGEEVSVSCYGASCLPRFQVRNVGDTAASIWINGNNTIGSQFGPIRFALGSFNNNAGAVEIARFEQNGDLNLLNDDLIIENQSLKARLADIEARLAALEMP